jgi:segregation and condensation protein B
VQHTHDEVQLVTAPGAAEAVQRFLGLEASGRLSGAALEVLSIVADRQPVTRPEIDELRGVNSEAALRTLAGRGLVEPVGRRETVGYPVEYATTFRFLEYFGLASLEDLPQLDAVAPGRPVRDGATNGA